MTDEAALLEAVLREPDADAPRLAYADWLQKAGGASHQARADLIRVQINLESVTDEDPHWPELANHERELLNSWASVWQRPFRDLLKPSLFRPGRWLKAQLFGQGGAWRFHRGFIEEIDTSAAAFFEEDSILFGHAPIRRVVLSNATSLIAALANDTRLDHLQSLHLIADAEFDEEMEGLRQAATASGLTVLALRYPRLQADYSAELLGLLSGDIVEPGSPKLEKLQEFRDWERATPRERDRLRSLAHRPYSVLQLTEPDHFSHSEILRLNDWVYLGDRVRDAGAWAVVKTFHDLEDDEGLCRRLVLFKEDQINASAFQELLESPHLERE
jgi:uncharacterized protein (TIGR02996 family)